MIPVFIRRREQTTGLTYVAVPHVRAVDPLDAPPAGEAMGMSSYAPLEDPVRYSEFVGGRGRPVWPASQDTWYTINPWLQLGGEGASWEWEHYGYKSPMQPRTLGGGDPGAVGGANAPIAGGAGMIAWPERANEYRPPWESYGAVVDQRTPNVAPAWESAAGGVNPLV